MFNCVYKRILCEVMGPVAYENKKVRKKYIASIVKRIYPDKLMKQVQRTI